MAMNTWEKFLGPVTGPPSPRSNEVLRSPSDHLMGHGCVLWEGWPSSQPLAFALCIALHFVNWCFSIPHFHGESPCSICIVNMACKLLHVCGFFLLGLETASQAVGWLMFALYRPFCQKKCLPDIVNKSLCSRSLGISMLRVEQPPSRELVGWRMFNLALINVPMIWIVSFSLVQMLTKGAVWFEESTALNFVGALSRAWFPKSSPPEMI